MFSSFFKMPDDPRPRDEVETRRELQAALMWHDKPKEEHIESYSFEWLRMHAEDFRIAYNELSAERPDLIRLWRETPDEAMRIMRERMKQVEER